MESMPYFDSVLKLKNRDEFFKKNLNMHWGYWSDPKAADVSSPDDFVVAAEEMCNLIFAQADIQPGMKIADVGCGFGGTINSINKKYSNLDMVGLNIDARQIEVANSWVEAENDNKIEFITGDACDLPFEDESIDVLLAVECIFHFPDREKFFAEAGRVLKPGGRMVFSDFVPVKKPGAIDKVGGSLVAKYYGNASPRLTLPQYAEIGQKYRLHSYCNLNITPNVMPTYLNMFDRLDKARQRVKSRTDLSFAIRMKAKRKIGIARLSTKILEKAHTMNRIRYMILGFEKAA